MRHNMFEHVNPSELERIIEMWVRGGKAERNRSILKERLLCGSTFEQLAERYEMSVRQIKNIVYRHEVILCDKIEIP